MNFEDIEIGQVYRTTNYAFMGIILDCDSESGEDEAMVVPLGSEVKVWAKADAKLTPNCTSCLVKLVGTDCDVVISSHCLEEL